MSVAFTLDFLVWAPRCSLEEMNPDSQFIKTAVDVFY